MREVPYHGHVLEASRFCFGCLNARTPHLERVHLADGAVGPLDGLVIHSTQRIQQLGARVPGVERCHAQRRLGEVPRFRKLGHFAQLHAAHVQRVASRRPARAREAHAHAAFRLQVAPMGSQAVVQHTDVIRDSVDQMVVEPPRRIAAFGAGIADRRVFGMVGAAVVAAAHGRLPFLKRRCSYLHYSQTRILVKKYNAEARINQ